MVIPLKSRIGIKTGVAVVRRRPGSEHYSVQDEEAMAMLGNVIGNSLRLSQVGEMDPVNIKESKDFWKALWATKQGEPEEIEPPKELHKIKVDLGLDDGHE